MAQKRSVVKLCIMSEKGNRKTLKQKHIIALDSRQLVHVIITIIKSAVFES